MNSSLAIPEGLRQQFDQLERRLWRFDTIVALCGCACALLLSYALIFVSDRLWDTPQWLRVIFTGGGVVAFFAFILGYGRRWIWGSRTFPALATLVQKRYRRLGDRLLGIVELADEKRRPANFSPALCQAAIGQVASEAAKVDFRQAVGTKRPRQYFLASLAAIALAAAFCIIAPQAGWNALWRWAMPTFHIARYTFVSLENLPDHLVVAHGEPFEIEVGVAAHSFLRPTEMTAQFEKQALLTAPVRHGSAVFSIAGQTQPGALTFRAGDIKRSIRIEPEFRPEIKQLTARIEMPAYLEYPKLEEKIDRGSLIFLKGSRVSFSGETTRALDRASIGAQPLRIDGATFFTQPMLPEGASQLSFTWKDKLGLASAAPAIIRLQEKEDAEPQVECRGLAGAIAILEEEVVHIDIAAADDYGICNVGVRWLTTPGHGKQLASAPVEHTLAFGRAQDRNLTTRYDFSPALLHIPADTNVTFCATVTDHFPQRAESLSEVHQIYVLSREAHARLIQEQLEKIMEQLEELTRRQEALLEGGKNVRAQTPQKLADSSSEKKLAEQAAEQKETAEQLRQLAQKTAETMREAMRNQNISQSTLQEWAQHAAAMQSLSQQEMPAAAQSLDSAKSDANDRAPKLDQAVAQESEILKKLHEMQKGADKSLEKLMTQNLAMRLRKIAGQEKGIVDDFQKILPETIGMKPEQLLQRPFATTFDLVRSIEIVAEPKETVERMTDLHAALREDSRELQMEIGRLFERTKLERFGDVANEMDKAKTDEGLEKLGQLIQKNVTVRAMQGAAEWSKRFNQWADRLSEKDDSKSGSGEGEGEPDMKAMLALMRLRQSEAALRDRTGALEQQKESNPRYDMEAEGTALAQTGVKTGVDQLQADPTFPVPPETLAPIGQAMGDASALLIKPETGAPTVAAETDAIDLLDEIIMSESQKSGKNSKAMAGLMRMMGMGKTPGGNTAGGDTDRPNIVVPGTRASSRPDTHRVVQASGITGAPVPAEFREAIENYQRAIEQEGSKP